MNQKVSLGVTISISALVCALTFIITSFVSLQNFNDKVQAVKEKAEQYDRLEAIDSYVREHYYLDELDEDALMNGILKGYVSGLNDPFSRYMTAEEYDALMTKEAGQQVGIGVTITFTEDSLFLITHVDENSPAQLAGLQEGDFITAVEGQTVADLGYEEAVNRVKGEEGTSVVLTIRHDGADKDLRITRHTYEVSTVHGQMLDNQIAYIAISAFRDNTSEQFQDTLDSLLSAGATGIIFDVRDNGGGVLTSLQKMLDPLLPEGDIATATYQGGRTETVVTSDSNELNLPMVVLVNGNTASAAELFAASLRDFKQAKLVGTQTYGKGIMQSTLKMPDGGGLTLTVATYQTTRSDNYHGIGLAPDIVMESGEHTIIGNADPDTDPQLSTAIDILMQ